jgi:uncharacterized RDD family membrane protein YckC
MHNGPSRPLPDSSASDSDLSLRYTAPTFRRVISFASDGLLLWLCAFLIGDQSVARQIIVIAVYFVMQAGMVVLFGQTPAGRVFGLYVVENDKFKPPQKKFPSVTWGGALIRAITLPLTSGFWFFSAASLLNPRRRTLSDWLSGTRVIHLRPRSTVPARRPVLFLVPVFVPILGFAALYFGSERIRSKNLADAIENQSKIIKRNQEMNALNSSPVQPTAGVTQIDERLIIASADFRSAMDQGMNAHLNSVRAIRHFENGKAEGFKLIQIKKGSLWDVLKFQDGDVICGIDDILTLEDAQFFSLPSLLQKNRKLKVCRVRSEVKTFVLLSLDDQGNESATSPPAATPVVAVEINSGTKKSDSAAFSEIRKASEAIASIARNNPAQIVKCRAQWKDATGAHEAPSEVRAGDSAGWPCLVFCLKTFEQNGIVQTNHVFPEGALCFSDGNIQGFPN